jgi:DMSO/TMAO reductase YedYZ molybdopterin-dependent catalytic subunit
MNLKRATKVTIIVFLILVITAVPLYFYTHQTPAEESVLEIKGQANSPMNLTFNQMQILTPLTIQVTISSSSYPSDNGNFNYTGISLQTLLKQADASENASSVYIQAIDGYGTTITMQEANSPNTMIAYQKNGASLSALKDGGEGPLRLIIGSDQYAQRWVRGVVSIEVR